MWRRHTCCAFLGTWSVVERAALEDEEIPMKHMLGVIGVVLLAASVGVAAPIGTAEMIYDDTTGEVWFDVGSTDVVNVKLQVNPSLLSIDTAAVTSLNGVDPSANDGANLNFFSSTGLPAGEDSVGEILPAGVTMDPGTNVIFQYQVTGQDTMDGTITTIPEPMTMSLLAVGGLGVLIRRKRR
jgi:hypothetical protein